MRNLLKYNIYIALLLIQFSCKKTETPISFTTINTPVSTRINKTFWLNPNEGFFCGGEKGKSGYIYHTTDAGSTWQQRATTNGKSLYDVFFVNQFTGYCCGESLMLLITHDGGITWNEFVYPFQPEPYYVLTLRNISGNENFLLICGGDNFNLGVSLRFINGGFPWEFSRFDTELRTAVPFAVGNYIAAGYGLSYQTTDTGYSFKPLSSSNDFITASSQIGNTSWACGYDGGIFKMHGSQTTWTKIDDANKLLKRRVHFNGIQMVNETNGYVVGDKGLLLKTTNGNDWQKCSPMGEANLLSIVQSKGGALVVSSADGKLYRFSQ